MGLRAHRSFVVRGKGVGVGVDVEVEVEGCSARSSHALCAWMDCNPSKTSAAWVLCSLFSRAFEDPVDSAELGGWVIPRPVSGAVIELRGVTRDEMRWLI